MPHYMVVGGLVAGGGGVDAALRICSGFTIAGGGRKKPVYASGEIIGIKALDVSPTSQAEFVGMQKVLFLSGDNLPELNSKGKGDDLVILGGTETWAIVSVVEQTKGSATVIATLINNGAQISFPTSAISDSSPIGTTVNAASISGAYSGTPVWSLTDNAGGQFAIDSASGSVTVAGSLLDGVQHITIAVGGTTPPISPNVFAITVANPNELLADVNSPILADIGQPILTQ